MSTIRRAALWLVNEALAIAGAATGLLVLTGRLTPEQADGWVDWVAGVSALAGTWIVRGGIDGPVTRRRRSG